MPEKKFVEKVAPLVQTAAEIPPDFSSDSDKLLARSC